jgi:hypothetical protein
MQFKLYTLADITPTGARRGSGDAYFQEQNYMSVIQTIGIRANPENVSVTQEEQSVGNLPFGKKYKGKQSVWCLTFDIGSQGGHNIEMLEEDFNLVPFNNNLNESITMETPIFLTKDDNLCNIFFTNSDK